MRKDFHLRLPQRIMAIGAVGLVGILVYGAINEVGFRKQDAARVAAESSRLVFELNQKLSIEMLEAQRNQKSFQIRKDKNYAKVNNRLFGQITSDFDQLNILMRTSGMKDLAEKIETAHKGFKEYTRVFEAFVRAEVKLGLSETLGLSGSLRSDVSDIEQIVDSADTNLTVAMLKMLKNEKEFMLRRDTKYSSAWAAAAADYSKALTEASVPAAEKSRITEKFENYKTSFQEWAEGAEQSAQLEAVMTKTFHDIEPIMNEVREHVEQLRTAADQAERKSRFIINMWVMIALGITVVLVSVISVMIGRSVSKALSAMVHSMTALASGDTSIAIPSRQRRDEIGEMAVAVQVFKENMVDTDRLRAQQAEIERMQVVQKRADMNLLAEKFEAAVGKIIDTVSSASVELEASASSLTHTAVGAQELSTVVAAASEQAYQNVQSVASASEEIVRSLNQISGQVQESALIANQAVAQANVINSRVDELSSAAERIGSIVQLIDGIAGQTNLLALNATIEAARAGEAGRGFSVVATEVKALAEQTANATGEIGEQISNIQTAAKISIKSIGEIGVTISKISEIASTIVVAVEGQGVVTQEVSSNVQQAAQGTQQVATSISEVQRGASETGLAASQVLASAQALSRESNRLKLEVTKFLDVVRSS